MQTLEDIIFEWLTDPDCFSEALIKKADVYPYIRQDSDRNAMNRPWCEYQIVVRSTESTGAGALNTEARFKNIGIEIALCTAKPSKQIDLVILGDILDDFFRNATHGRPALGQAGFRKAVLTGPNPDHQPKYYQARWFLDGQILVSNA